MINASIHTKARCSGCHRESGPFVVRVASISGTLLHLCHGCASRIGDAAQVLEAIFNLQGKHPDVFGHIRRGG